MVTAIIQARMSSSRLPGKVLKDLCGKPVIAHILDRLQQCQNIQKIIVATSDNPSDDILANYVKEYGATCYRGSLNNVLDRYYQAVALCGATDIVRICADSPLLDKEIIDQTIEFYQHAGVSIVKTTHMPLGLGTEVFSFSALQQAHQYADKDYQKDFLTSYMYEYCPSKAFVWQASPSPYRLTLDTPEDFEVIACIYNGLYRGEHNFYSKEIIHFLEDHPQIAKINEHIQQIQVPLDIHTDSYNCYE